jgi:hypothetical protein
VKRPAWIALFVFLALESAGFAEAKEEKHPEREMLRLIDLLREWDLIRNLDMMRELQSVETAGDDAPGDALQKQFPRTRKEAVK